MKHIEFETHLHNDDDDEMDCFGRSSSSCADYNQSYLEKNCNQIFVKGPALTKEILEKMNADLVPEETYLFGHELKTRRVLLTAGLSILFFLSLFGFSVMWYTDIFQNYTYSKLTISNESDNYEFWKKPTPKPLFHVYLFNYSNVDEYKYKMDPKLHVEEIGPYVYQESLEKVNIKFIGDDTVEYQEKREYIFQPHLSKGKQNDQIIVPNMPLMSGSAILKNQNYFARLAFSGILSGLEEKPFVTLPVDKFIMGYDDPLYEFSKNLNQLNNIETPEQFGLFAFKKGVQPKVYTVNTGVKDIDKLGFLEKLDDEEELDLYSTPACNSLTSSVDGTYYPPKLVKEKQDLFYYFPQMCRKMPLIFEKETTIFDGKVPAYQYTQPEEIFDTPEEKPENQCFCSQSGQCPLKGLFNITACSLGSPLFTSNPHFHRADERVQNGVTGLNPNGRDYKVTAIVHPTYGFMMAGRATMQINIQVQKAYGVSQMDMFDEGLILPIAWFDVVMSEENLPTDFVDIINLVTFTVKRVKLALEYGSLLTMLMTFVCLLLVLQRWWNSCKNSRTTTTHNNQRVLSLSVQS